MTLGGIAPIPKAEREGAGMSREAPVKSKILSHFIKGKVSLSPMETVLMIPGELEHLENLVKLARRKRDSESGFSGLCISIDPKDLRQQDAPQ